jgi:hypothetical protein
MWDLFISHASEDKDAVARPLAARLANAGLKVWFDEQTLRLGDSLSRKIDEGLSTSRFGVVVLSPSFFAKEWPKRELDALFSREVGGEKVILPVWHNVDHAAVSVRSPLAAAKLAVSTSQGLDEVVRQILVALGMPVSSGESEVATLRFSDNLTADPISVKVAVRKFLERRCRFQIAWPSSLQRLVGSIEETMQSAEQHYEPDSPFYGCAPDIVSNFLDTAASGLSTAQRIQLGAAERVPFLIEGMRDYWGGLSHLIERAVVNFLNLANFDAQFSLVYAFGYKPVLARMPSEWHPWFEPLRSSNQNYAQLFNIDEEVCRARVRDISGVYIDQYFWGPRSMVLQALQTGVDQAITNPWFVRFLIPQVELSFVGRQGSPALKYRERAVVTKVLSEAGHELS